MRSFLLPLIEDTDECSKRVQRHQHTQANTDQLQCCAVYCQLLVSRVKYYEARTGNSGNEWPYTGSLKNAYRSMDLDVDEAGMKGS